MRARIPLILLLALLALIAAVKIRYPGKAPVKLPSGNCDGNLWNHVYEKDRLRLLEECTTVEGRVLSLNRGADGDLHIELDPEQKSVLNLFNMIHGRGKLVVEVICEHKATKAAAQAACDDFHPNVSIPKAGDRIRVTGAYVTDRDNGWNEIHPATQIEILR